MPAHDARGRVAYNIREWFYMYITGLAPCDDFTRACQFPSY